MTRLTSLLVLVLSLAACDTAAPGPDSLDGTYSATSFRLLDAATGEVHYDLLANGSSFEITLRDGSTMSGQAFIPYRAFVESGTTDDIDGDFDVAFDGTYRQSGDQVRFIMDPDAFVDTFVDAAPWTLVDDGRGLAFSSDEDDLTFEITVVR